MRKKKKELTKEEKREELEQALDIEKKSIEVFINQIRISRKKAATIMEELERMEDGKPTTVLRNKERTN